MFTKLRLTLADCSFFLIKIKKEPMNTVVIPFRPSKKKILFSSLNKTYLIALSNPQCLCS